MKSRRVLLQANIAAGGGKGVRKHFGSVSFWRERRQDSVVGRARRVDVGGMIYHALNRVDFRSRLFPETAHYEDFFGVLEEGLNFVPLCVLAYYLMPNHGPLVLYPRAALRSVWG